MAKSSDRKNPVLRNGQPKEAARPPVGLTRGDCMAGGVNATRPCLYGGCRYHLRGHVSCVLDVADEGGAEMGRVASILGITKCHAEHIERVALRKLQQGSRRLGLGLMARDEADAWVFRGGG